MERNVPRGYDWKDGKLQVNETESKIVKWIYQMVIEYQDNPPDILIRQIIDECEGEEISYEEAKERVSLTMVKKYMVAELNLRMEEYEKNRQGDTSSEIENFLEMPLEGELLDIIEERYKDNYEDAYGTSILSENKKGRYLKNIESLSKEDYRPCKTEPLISKEIYKAAIEKMEENREQSLNNNPTMMIE